MSKADVLEVARLLRDYAQRSALRGGNPCRAKAYTRAADSLTALAVPLETLIAEGRLTEIPGVGDAIADIITKLHREGYSSEPGKAPQGDSCRRAGAHGRACGRTRC